MSELIILDGPLGSELARRGVETPLPEWSAGALESHPDMVVAIHRAYAAAGATVHTTNTFRTRPATCGPRWAALATRAVELARDAVGEATLLGSIAPLADCYRPDRSPFPGDPAGTERAHRALADVLVDSGCDALLCETFPHPGEGLAAARAASATGRPVWLALTAGPDADLLTPAAMADAAREAAELGVEAFLVNCTPAVETRRFLDAIALAAKGTRMRIGAYANAGHVDDAIGWRPEEASEHSVQRYVELASGWRDAGATLLGSCCGTGPEHVRALAAHFAPPAL